MNAFLMRYSFLFLFTWIFLVSFAQKTDRFREAAEIIDGAPDSAYVSVPAFAAWMKENFHDEHDLLCAIYVWTAGAISYDVEKMYLVRYEEKPEEVIEKTFRTRLAVCQGYSELFNDLCRRTGIRSFVVNGYTKQNGEVSSLGHAWVVVETGSEWRCIDPTWGAGYIVDGSFVKNFHPEYFMADPSRFISSHMPLDPMWQLLEHPYTVPEFYAGARNSGNSGPSFAFSDSISDYMRLDKLKQAEVTLRRVNEAGIYNKIIRDYARYLTQILENEEIRKRNDYQKQQVDRLNLAVDHYNRAVKQFNEYINYFNRQYKPIKPDEELREMLESPGRELNLAHQYLEKTDPFSLEMEQNMEQLENTISALKQNVYEQEKFLRKYLSAPKSGREKLFRQQY